METPIDPAVIHTRHVLAVNVLVADVEELYRAYQERGAKFLFPVADKPWGLREFGVLTPDAHPICFGQEIDPSPT